MILYLLLFQLVPASGHSLLLSSPHLHSPLSLQHLNLPSPWFFISIAHRTHSYKVSSNLYVFSLKCAFPSRFASSFSPVGCLSALGIISFTSSKSGCLTPLNSSLPPCITHCSALCMFFTALNKLPLSFHLLCVYCLVSSLDSSPQERPCTPLDPSLGKVVRFSFWPTVKSPKNGLGPGTLRNWILSACAGLALRELSFPVPSQRGYIYIPFVLLKVWVSVPQAYP